MRLKMRLEPTTRCFSADAGAWESNGRRTSTAADRRKALGALHQLHQFLRIRHVPQYAGAVGSNRQLARLGSCRQKQFAKAPKNYPLALAAAQQGESSQAIKLLTEVSQHNPSYAPAFTNLGLQLLKTGKNDDAESQLKKALELDPKNAVVYNHLGVISRINGDFETARGQYQKAIQYNPGYANAHLNLGILLDLYLYELDDALLHDENYQSLSANNDDLVGKRIIDLQLSKQNQKKLNIMNNSITKLTKKTPMACPAGFANTAHCEEQMTMEGISIIGNKELPNVLYILPVKSPDLPDMNEPVLTGLFETSLEPVDREALLRRELYSRAFKTR